MSSTEFILLQFCGCATTRFSGAVPQRPLHAVVGFRDSEWQQFLSLQADKGMHCPYRTPPRKILERDCQASIILEIRDQCLSFRLKGVAIEFIGE
jgi:hypothetical protein